VKQEIRKVDMRILEGKLRINSRSKKVAVYTKHYLEAKYGVPFDLAVSSRNIIMLDTDVDSEEALAELQAIGMALTKEFGGTCLIFKTPNGYHLVHVQYVPHRLWRQFYSLLKVAIKKGDIKYVDLAHVEATLRRDYATLRLNQEKLIWSFP